MLAAGTASRMGRAKQLLPWGQRTILEQTLLNVSASDVAHVVVITGHRAAEVAAIARRAGAATLHNPDYASGEMLSSLQLAVRQLPQTCLGVLVVLADQPLVEAQTMNRLLVAFADQPDRLVAPVYEGRRGNPVLIGRAYFSELLALPPGAAPRHLLQRHPDQLRLVVVDSPSVLLDIDRPTDYEAHRPPDLD